MDPFLLIIGIIIWVLFRAAAAGARRRRLPGDAPQDGSEQFEAASRGTDAVAQAQARALEALRRWEARQRPPEPGATTDAAGSIPVADEADVSVAPATAARAAPGTVSPVPTEVRPPVSPVRSALILAGTSGPVAWRQAILHAEILGPPVSLRGRAGRGRLDSPDPGGGGER